MVFPTGKSSATSSNQPSTATPPLLLFSAAIAKRSRSRTFPNTPSRKSVWHDDQLHSEVYRVGYFGDRIRSDSWMLRKQRSPNPRNVCASASQRHSGWRKERETRIFRIRLISYLSRRNARDPSRAFSSYLGRDVRPSYSSVDILNVQQPKSNVCATERFPSTSRLIS